MNIEFDLKEKEIVATQKAYDYVLCHYDLSTQNPDDREHVTTLLTLANKILEKITKEKA